MVAQIHQPPYPLHHSVRDRLHPDYVAFYNKYLLHQQPAHYLSISTSRLDSKVLPGCTAPLLVGRTRDFSIPRRETRGPKVNVRCFTPQGTPPRSGWPLVMYFHGGGWVFGNIDTENTVCTNMCARSKVVVVTTDYRLAPEEPWPAAIHDSWEALLWATGEGASLLEVDVGKVAVAGASAGANIAAVIAQKAAVRPSSQFHISLQLLVVPITDNTATPINNAMWKQYEFTAALPAKKMLWYRQHYLPNEAEWPHVEASPLLAGKEVFERLPRAVILVGELDVLRGDGEEYARKLKANGVGAEVIVMEGMPHPFLAMDAVLEAGKRGITILCDSLTREYGEI